MNDYECRPEGFNFLHPVDLSKIRKETDVSHIINDLTHLENVYRCRPGNLDPAFSIQHPSYSTLAVTLA